MAEITRRQTLELANAAGLDLDDARADAVAARLNAVLDELGKLPADALADVEPLPVFSAGEASHE